MARTRRRAYPSPGSSTIEREDRKYGKRGNARHKRVKANARMSPEQGRKKR